MGLTGLWGSRVGRLGIDLGYGVSVGFMLRRFECFNVRG